MSPNRSMAVVLAVLAGCLLFAGCTGKPRGQGTVQPNTGGRGGNSMSANTGQDVQLFFDDEDLSPTRPVGYSHAGSKVTVVPLDGVMPAWLQMTPPQASGTYSGQITLTFTPQREEPHTERTTLRFTASDADGTNAVYDDLVVTATRVQRITPARELLTLAAGTQGMMTRRIDLAAASRWTTSASQQWTRLSQGGGEGNAAINVEFDAGALAPGEHYAFLDFIDVVTQRRKTYSLLIVVDQRRLDTEERGLAFSATAGASRLTRELHITDSSDLDGHWQISDDAAWLTATTPAGAGDAVVALNADPTGLADGLYFATVTVSPDNEPGLTHSSVVRVGFHVDRSTPANTAIAMEGAPPAGVLEADPIRPWLFGFDRSGANSTLRVWNFHTGALRQTLNVPNLSAARARVALDGRLLVVSDVDNRQFVAFPLSTEVGAPLAPWTAMRFNGRFEDFEFANINGAEAIAWSAGQLLSAQNGAVLANFDQFPTFYAPTIPPALSIAADGRFGCMVTSAGGRSDLWFFVLSHRAGTFGSFGASGGRLVGVAATDCLSDSRTRNTYTTVDGAVRRYPYYQIVRDRERPAAADELQRLSNGELYLSGGNATWKHLSPALDEIATRALSGDRLRGLVSSDESRLFERVSSGTQLTGTFRNRDF
jgi:hypothetical protein